MKILLCVFSLTLVLCFPYLPSYTSHSRPEVTQGQVFQMLPVHLKMVLSNSLAVMLLVNGILLGGPVSSGPLGVVSHQLFPL